MGSGAEGRKGSPCWPAPASPQRSHHWVGGEGNRNAWNPPPPLGGWLGWPERQIHQGHKDEGMWRWVWQCVQGMHGEGFVADVDGGGGGCEEKRSWWSTWRRLLGLQRIEKWWGTRAVSRAESGRQRKGRWSGSGGRREIYPPGAHQGSHDSCHPRVDCTRWTWQGMEQGGGEGALLREQPAASFPLSSFFFLPPTGLPPVEKGWTRSTVDLPSCNILHPVGNLGPPGFTWPKTCTLLHYETFLGGRAPNPEFLGFPRPPYLKLTLAPPPPLLQGDGGCPGVAVQ